MKSISDLKGNTVCSGFNRKMTQNMIQKVTICTERLGPISQKQETDKSPISHTTNFSQYLKHLGTQCCVNPESRAKYKRIFMLGEYINVV